MQPWAVRRFRAHCHPLNASGRGGAYFFLVFDHADDTVFGRRGLAIVDTSNHARVDVWPIASTAEERAGVVIVAHAVMNRGAFEILGSSRTGANHISAASVNNRHIKNIIRHNQSPNDGKLQRTTK